MRCAGRLQPSLAWTGLGASLVLALVLRLWCSHYSPWFDEWMSAWFAGRPLADLWSSWMVRETNPPLYYTLLKGWSALFGPQALAMRALSVLAGVASVTALAACAWLLAGRRGALIAALLTALCAHHVFYATQIRGYVFAELAFALSLFGLLLLLREDAVQRQRRTGTVLYVLGAAAAVHFHTTMVAWPVAATTVVLGMTAMRKCPPGRFAQILAASAAVAAISSWWLYITVLQLNSGAENVSWIPETTLKAYISLFRQSVFLIWSNDGLLKAASYLVALLALSGVVGKHRPAALLLIALLASSAAVFLLASLVKPIVLGRTLFWMSGLVVVLLSTSLAGLRPAWLGTAAATGLCGLLLADLLQARSSFQTEDWQGYVRFQASAPPGTVLVHGTSSAIVARKVCTVELAAACRLRFAAIGKAGPFADGDAPPLVLKRGAPPPVSGPVYLLDAAGGAASSHFTLPEGVPARSFAGLRLRGPVGPERLIAR